jgi:hypothetical protein
MIIAIAFLMDIAMPSIIPTLIVVLAFAVGAAAVILRGSLYLLAGLCAFSSLVAAVMPSVAPVSFGAMFAIGLFLSAWKYPRPSSQPQHLLTAPLYRRILGDRFDRLPAVLRRFHDSNDGGRARGKVKVTRPAGRLHHLLGLLLRLPRAGCDVPLDLQVTVDGERERWIRQFGDSRMETTQWNDHGLLIEAAGSARFAFKLVVEDTSMHFQCVRVWLFSVPLPGFIAPVLKADVCTTNANWSVDVQVVVPGLGQVLRYQGTVVPEYGNWR